MKSQAGWGAVFSCTLWSVNRCFANGGWYIGITIRGPDKEAVTFQRYFVPKRPPPPVTGSFIFPQLSSHLSPEMCSSCAIQGRLHQLVCDALPSPSLLPRVQQSLSILSFVWRSWWLPTIHPLLMWMTRQPGRLCQLQRQVKVLLVKLLQPFFLPGTIQALPHACFECLEQCCLNTVGCTPQMLERGTIWPSDFPLQSTLFMR